MENIINESKSYFLRRENSNLILFLTGKSISLFGSSIYAFVIGLYLLKTTGSGLSFALNLALYTLPVVLFNPLAGVMADKLDKKKLVVGSDLLNGVFLACFYIYVINNGLSINLLYFSTFIITVLAVFFDTAVESAKPNLVSENKLVKINSLARVIESTSFIAGPLLGGIIYVLINTELFILFNAISFITAAILEFFIDYNYNCKTQKLSDNQIISEKENFVENLKEGYRYIFRNKYLKGLVIIFVSLNFFFNFTIVVPLPYILNNIWKIKSSIYGIIQGGFPVGMIIGALLTDRLLKKVNYSKLLSFIIFITGTAVILFVLPMIIFSTVPDQLFVLIYFSLLMFFTGLAVAWIDVPANVLIQKLVPNQILGRVISVKFSIIKIIVPISLLSSGYFINHFSPAAIIISGSLIFIIFNLVFFSSSLGKHFLTVDEQI